MRAFKIPVVNPDSKSTNVAPFFGSQQYTAYTQNPEGSSDQFVVNRYILLWFLTTSYNLQVTSVRIYKVLFWHVTCV